MSVEQNFKHERPKVLPYALKETGKVLAGVTVGLIAIHAGDAVLAQHTIPFFSFFSGAADVLNNGANGATDLVHNISTNVLPQTQAIPHLLINNPLSAEAAKIVPTAVSDVVKVKENDLLTAEVATAAAVPINVVRGFRRKYSKKPEIVLKVKGKSIYEMPLSEGLFRHRINNAGFLGRLIASPIAAWTIRREVKGSSAHSKTIDATLWTANKRYGYEASTGEFTPQRGALAWHTITHMIPTVGDWLDGFGVLKGVAHGQFAKDTVSTALETGATFVPILPGPLLLGTKAAWEDAVMRHLLSIGDPRALAVIQGAEQTFRNKHAKRR